MAIQMQSAIEINNISKVYNSRSGEQIKAVNDLNLSIQTGQVFGFLGANGAGKTTTIKMMCGLVKPTSGSVHLNGFSVESERHQAMQQIGAVLEGTRNVYWRLSALENVLYFGRLKGVPNKELRERAELLLTELDLWERRKDKIRTFSRGMQQKVAIACALISDPPIVLLDEPTLGLDVKAAITVKNWIANLAQQRQKTIVLTTHHLDMAQELCDSIAIMNKGHLLTNQPKSELLDLFRSNFYEIKVAGSLNGQANAISTELVATHEGEYTVLTGAIDTQDDLFDVLNKIRSTGYSLVSVAQAEPNLEQIFIDYMDTAEVSA